MIEEIKLREKNLQEYVDKQKRAFSSMFETDNVKLLKSKILSQLV